MEELFYSEQHRDFYRHHVDGGADPYYRALVYLLGMTEETRTNFSRCFDGEARMIRPAALEEGWQTGGTARIVRMAFNLWNGWCYESEEEAQDGRMSEAFTPDNLFCCEFAPYFYEAIKLRHPEYTDHPLEVSCPSRQGPPADGKPDGTLCALEANPTPQAEQHK